MCVFANPVEKKNISICFYGSSPVIVLKTNYQAWVDLIDKNAFSLLDSHNSVNN